MVTLRVPPVTPRFPCSENLFSTRNPGFRIISKGEIVSNRSSEIERGREREREREHGTNKSGGQVTREQRDNYFRCSSSFAETNRPRASPSQSISARRSFTTGVTLFFPSFLVAFLSTWPFVPPPPFTFLPSSSRVVFVARQRGVSSNR